jgi:hypothetical protein
MRRISIWFSVSSIRTRQNGITIISGMQGVGKSYNIKKIIKDYVRDLKDKSGKIIKKGGKVLIYDVNDEYTDIEPIAWNMIGQQKLKTIRRVLPFRKVNGKIEWFGTEELQKGFLTLLSEYRGGLLILEDFNTYALNTRTQKVLSTLTRARHKQIDILIVLQDIGKVTRELWSNLSFYFYHKQTSDIDKERDKITNFPMVKIADNIVTEQFEMAELYYENKKITEDQYKIYRSFHVKLNFKTNRITGCSKEAFERAVKKYIKITGKEKEVREYCFSEEISYANADNKAKAYQHLIRKYSIFYGGE